MAAQRKGRRAPWGSLIIAVILLAVGVAILMYVPSSPLDRTHVNAITTPGQVTLPPTAPQPTPTFTLSPTTATAGATPSPTR
jgi:hypothetical protein